MKYKANACYKCEDRFIGCHATCERYKEYCIKNEKEKDRRREDSRYTDTSWAYLHGRNKNGIW